MLIFCYNLIMPINMISFKKIVQFNKNDEDKNNVELPIFNI